MKKLYVLFAFLFCILISCEDIINSDQNIIKEKITVVDIDNNEYKTVPICEKRWMAENLNVSHYRNGDPVTHAASHQEWIEANENKEGAWCYYENDPENGQKFGKLYNWFAVTDPRGLAPEGWHVPSRDEWRDLFQCLGGIEVAGGKLKSTKIIEGDNEGWHSPNKGATNEYDFNALPGGYCNGFKDLKTNQFHNYGYIGYWWTSTEYEGYDANAHYFSLFYNSDGVGLFGALQDYKVHGYSVRCIKD